MKKLVMEGPGKSTLADVEMVHIKDVHDVIVKLKYCGVCMSEHYDWEHAGKGQSFGHEPVGVVCEVGEKVSRVRVGDRVSGPFDGGSEYSCTNEKNLMKIPDSVKDEDPESVYVVGGGTVYTALLPYCKRVYMTRIDATAGEPDTYFPNLDKLPDWEVEKESEPLEENGITYRFVDYINKNL